MFTDEQLTYALNNSDHILNQLEREDCEKSLLNFMTAGWESLEPGQPFLSNWAIEAICDHLEAVTRGELTRLLINVPPGCTKSMTTNVFWPAWEWGPKNLPHYRYISCSYNKDLSIRDNVRGRELVKSEWYQRHWQDRFGFNAVQDAKIYYENDQRGWRFSSSTGAGLTGWRGDRIILDDPHSVGDIEYETNRENDLRWFSETLPTRLNNLTQSSIVVIMQRVHERDVSGLILAKELNYEHLMLPMEFESDRRCYSSVKPSYRKDAKKVKVYYHRSGSIWHPIPPEEKTDPNPKCEERYDVDMREEDGDLLHPDRFPLEVIEDLKQAFRSWGGTYAEAGQLQQRPAPRGGGLFKKQDFHIIDIAPEGGRTVRGWDLASSKNKHAAYTVGLKMKLHEGNIYILDVERLRGSPREVEQAIVNCATRDGKSVSIDLPQDPGQAGKFQKSYIAQQLHGYKVVFSPETGSKEDRAGPLAAQVEAGNVYMVRAPWNDTFLNEATVFPNGEFKDQIDAASRAYSNLVQKRRRKVGVAPVLVHA